MQSFASLTLLVSLALSSLASPIERAASISCETTPATTRRLSSYDGNNTFYYSLGNTTTADHLGAQSKVLISQSDAGSAFSIQNATDFDFYSCNSTYLGTHPTGDYKSTLLYGLLKPKGQSKHCLQTQSGSVSTATQVFTNSVCSTSEDASQLQQTFSYFPNDGLTRFISSRQVQGATQHPTYLTRSDNGTRALQLNAGTGKDTQQLSLVPGPE